MSINRDLAKAIGAAVAGGKITSSGLLNTPAAVTSYAYDSAGPLLAADSSGYDDGSLHYLSKLREVYVWDDSDGGFFKVDKLSDDPLSGGGAAPSSYQGTQYGYSTAGGTGSPEVNTVDKFSFSADGNATDVGDYIENAKTGAGSSSSTAGYVSGGFTSSNTYLKSINKRTFASDASESNIGNLAGASAGTYRNAGSSSSTNGYHSGGTTSNDNAPFRTTINKISFSTDGDASDAGDLSRTRGEAASISSITDGYAVGGSSNTVPAMDDIDKFPFASDANAVDVGSLPANIRNVAGQNSSTHGYISGGTAPTVAAMMNEIRKFAFASESTTASDVGDLTVGRYGVAGTSSTSSGYTAGGHYPAAAVGSIIEKFPFASDANATDVGDLTQGRSKFAPTQI